MEADLPEAGEALSAHSIILEGCSAGTVLPRRGMKRSASSCVLCSRVLMTQAGGGGPSCGSRLGIAYKEELRWRAVLLRHLLACCREHPVLALGLSCRHFAQQQQQRPQHHLPASQTWLSCWNGPQNSCLTRPQQTTNPVPSEGCRPRRHVRTCARKPAATLSTHCRQSPRKSCESSLLLEEQEARSRCAASGRRIVGGR